MRRQNKCLLMATFLRYDEADDDAADSLSYTRRTKAADFLLDLDTGPFSGDTIYHHCKLGCCNNKFPGLF